MGLFGNLFKQKEDTYSDFNWTPLLEINQLDEILTNSNKKIQIIFKHSTRCGVSRGVIKQFEDQNENIKNIDFYFLDLIAFRNISNAIAQNFNVEHQSPQLIVLKNKKIVAHASHYSIIDLNLKEL